MQIDGGMIAIGVTILLALLALAAAWGKLSEKVGHNKEDIDKAAEINRIDHQQIFLILDDIRKELFRGNGKLP